MFFDGSKDSKSQRVLSGFNPDKNLVLSPRNQMGISGDLGPLGFQGDQGMFFAHAILLLKIQTAYQGFLGLEELAKMASQCEHVGTEMDGAKQCQVLKCSLPGKDPEQTTQHFRVYLDESQDYLISALYDRWKGLNALMAHSCRAPRNQLLSVSSDLTAFHFQWKHRPQQA
jgi:hypothetical protein